MYPGIENPPQFISPFGALIVGPIMSVKSVLVAKSIKERNVLIDKPFARVVYCYGERQPGFEELKKTTVELYHGLEEVFQADTFFNPEIPSLLILDDLADEPASNPRATKLFTQGIHHRDVSVIFITQNL